MYARQKAIKRFRHEQKEKLKQSPDYIAKKTTVQSFNNDVSWSYPFISIDEHAASLVVQQNLNKLCNDERKTAIKLSRNSQTHPSINFRSSLKPFFDKHKAIYWQAVVSDISMPKPNSHFGFLLLDHLIMSRFNKDDFKLAFTQNDDQIDYHVWLSIQKIKYFGKTHEQKISIGDVIIGQSFVERYHDSNKNIHFGLGKTIIDFCGIPIVDSYQLEKNAIKAKNARIVSNYDRADDWVVSLRYPRYYESILGRYHSINMKTLQFIKGNLSCKYQLNKYHKYFDLNSNNAKLKNYSEFQDAVEGKR